jgi:hypothetical protein
MDDDETPIEQIQADDELIGRFNAELRRRIADMRPGLDLKSELAAICTELDADDGTSDNETSKIRKP